ncbi:EthD domain-containing protein [Williamsia deligens]|uniref:EthD domain-containing protein n=1 Tax=Williamsia deligens TaxID=321325 RepID=A0ABW3G6L5_9NOCA|nr:EthD domain-containing protein [Williamsia deligens]MCP2194755.1 EthD domain-containing protein [Williamsia deligens]
MSDFVFAVWGDDRQVLLDPALHRRAGARVVQTNLAGDPRFAGAFALQAMPEPIDAVVTVVDADDPARVESALREVARRVVGWEVQRRTPIPPPPSDDGEPADAMANVAFLRRPADMAHEAWLARWIGHHTPVAIATQGTFGYVQNIVVAPVTDDVEHVDGIVEELFPVAAASDPHAFYGSGGDEDELSRRMAAMLDSVVAIGAHRDIDVVPTIRRVHTVPSPG